MTTLSPSDIAKKACAEMAGGFVKDGMNVGLGTGSTAVFLVDYLGQRVKDGLNIRAAATSTRTAQQARACGIDVCDLNDLGRLDITIDGADEFDRDLQLIKGGGGAHLQEKIVAAASDKLVVIADASKAVDRLGAFPLPVEVLRFGRQSTLRHLQGVVANLGYADKPITLRQKDGADVITDEGNCIFDLHMGQITDAMSLAAALKSIPGVVEHGLFLRLAQAVVVGRPDGSTLVYDAADSQGVAAQIFA